MSLTEPQSRRLPAWNLIAHSLVMIPITGAMAAMATYLPPIYAGTLGISLYVLGAIFLFERIWGTLTDPLVGWLCDRTTSRFGRRKVWIAWGSLLFGLSYAFLFFPMGWITPVTMTVALLVLFLAWSMIVVPFYAWSGELSADYHERTRVTTYQTLVGSAMSFAVLLLPTLSDWLWPGEELLKLNLMGAAIVLPMIPGTILALRAFPDSVAPPPRIPRPKVPWRDTVRAVLGETVLWKVMLADFAILFAQSIRGGLLVFYVAFVIGMPRMAAFVMLFQFTFGMLAPPIWQAIAKRMGKHRATVLAELLQVAINLSLVFAGKGDIALVLVLAFFQGLTQGSGNLLLRSMLADVADEHRLRTGVDRTAMLFSVFSVSGKAGSAIPLGLALPLIAWFGFDPTLPTQTPEALWALALTFSLGNAACHLIATLLIRGFTLDEDRQQEIRAELERLQST